MASFDVESLFTNIPLLQETIDLCVESLFKDRTHIDKQHYGVEMVSQLGLPLANVFLCYHEKILLQNCPSEFKPVIYRRYVNVYMPTFSLETSRQKISKLLKSST